jgi:hypothetical protein
VAPEGGIVTFTPAVLAMHSAETTEFIKKIHCHPFWSAFILPSVFGTAVKMRKIEDATMLHET